MRTEWRGRARAEPQEQNAASNPCLLVHAPDVCCYPHEEKRTIPIHLTDVVRRESSRGEALARHARVADQLRLALQHSETKASGLRV